VPFILSHAIAGSAVAGATLPFRERVPRRILWLGALCAAFPDFDYAWAFGTRGSQAWYAHRGISHTPLVAALLAALLVWLAVPREVPAPRGRIWLALFLATISHPLLDALTNYGPGIPFFFPFSVARYKLAWRPLTGDWDRQVGLLPRLFTWWWKEVLWIWLPAAVVLALTARRRKPLSAPRP
jgi:inner membrane protein